MVITNFLDDYEVLLSVVDIIISSAVFLDYTFNRFTSISRQPVIPFSRSLYIISVASFTLDCGVIFFPVLYTCQKIPPPVVTTMYNISQNYFKIH